MAIKRQWCLDDRVTLYLGKLFLIGTLGSALIGCERAELTTVGSPSAISSNEMNPSMNAPATPTPSAMPESTTTPTSTASPAPSFSPSPTPAATGTPAPTSTPAPTPTPTPVATATPAFAIRVAAGRTASYVDSKGKLWDADRNYIGGNEAVPPPGTVAGTDDSFLYLSERWGANTSNWTPDSFKYDFPVPQGTYLVTLKFAEVYFAGPGERSFHVHINGTRLLANFDIAAEAGGAFRAIDKQFMVPVGSDGRLVLDFIPGLVNNPKISAIEIIQVNPSTEVRVAAGNSAYTDSVGKIWSADTNFSGGGFGLVSPFVLIAGTADSMLYNGQRWSSATPLIYTFNVPAGKYAVRLKFVEHLAYSIGQRVFHVSINGVPVLTNFDIVAAAGGVRIAVDQAFVTQVDQTGQLQIVFSQGPVENAKINAIEILAFD